MMHATSQQKRQAKTREIFPPFKDLMNRTPDISTDHKREEQSKASSNPPQKMTLFFRKIHDFLQQTAVFSSFPLSLSLIGFEELMEIHVFACPCRHDLNAWLTASIFIGPTFFIFALMYVLLRPFRHDWFNCSQGVKDDTRQNWPKALAHCMVPSLMWFIILLLDGDYIACAMTDWKGVYVFDVELNRSWCKPTKGMQSETELQDLIRMYIHQSRVSGYFISFFFSVFTIILVIIFDCHISGKCDCCQNRLSSCCRRTAQTQSEEQGPTAMGLEQQVPGSSGTTGQQESRSSATAGQKQQASGSSATVGWQLDSSATAGQGQQGSGSSTTMGSSSMMQELQKLLPLPHQGEHNDNYQMSHL
ncbi:uncharacterized protein si:dkeyp-122a9.1 [Ctenopharyngodon idella]|uniref:uncharacterized protein si:dkeyp-122a9.1 n=1 Tax=Ctenopharyngodon idella TaxID=7959 RepID=UPI002230D14E|nr:uncharacterized protein si:dkeyp-122a9.1 [Ctenopharyngodon idella]